MKSVDFRCDLCGEPASEWLLVYRHEMLDGMRQGAHDITEIDLCPTCAERVWGVISGTKQEDRHE